MITSNRDTLSLVRIGYVLYRHGIGVHGTWGILIFYRDTENGEQFCVVFLGR